MEVISMVIKKCVICDKEFDAKRKQKFCSKKCRSTKVFCATCGKKCKPHSKNDDGKYICSTCYKKSKDDIICPVCGKPIVGKYTRVVGFLTKVNNWNKTRRSADFPNRQFYGSINI